jgi:hypothetical protein
MANIVKYLQQKIGGDYSSEKGENAANAQTWRRFFLTAAAHK